MMNEIKLKAPAKINLFLKVLGKRNDGYHEIYSWFQAISLFDFLTFKKIDDSNFSLKVTNNPRVPDDDTNLIIKTAKLMFDSFELSGGLEISLEKNIPVSAGLAGGSTDAAATIYAINELFELNLETEGMKKLGAEIGSDVPFFFSSGQTEVTGRGEVTKDVKLPLDYDIVLVKPDFDISTKDSYENLNLNLTMKTKTVNFLESRGFRTLINQISPIGNDFESGAFKSYSELSKIQEALDGCGSLLTRMSGSGPTMFGLFRNMPKGNELGRFIRGSWSVFSAHPITLPAWHQVL